MIASEIVLSVHQIPVSTTEFDIKTVFEPIAEQAYSLLLESANDAPKNGRFHMVMLDPECIVTHKSGVTKLVYPNTNEEHIISEDPFSVTESRVSELRSAVQFVGPAVELLSALPFTVGAAGMSGYDVGRCYEVLPSIAVDDYQSPDYAVGIYTHVLVYDRLEHLLVEIKPEHKPSIALTSKEATDNTQPFELTTSWQSNLGRKEYLDKLTQVKAYLTAGDCYQINFAQRFSANYRGSEWQAYKHLSQKNSAPFSGFFSLPDSKILSISPERFLSVKQKQVETKPIKGTRPRSSDPELDAQYADELKSADKDRAENLMIVDLLRNDLSKHCLPGSVKVPKLFDIESFKAVHHLVSTVTGTLKPTSSPQALLTGAFPGGSITGAPKVRAMEIIDELEPHRRNIYCGSLFYSDVRGNMDSSICIRTLLAENNTLYCWAGGGIVIDSVPESEYQETLDKVSKILPVLEDVT